MMSNAEVKQSFVCQRLKACRKQKKKKLAIILQGLFYNFDFKGIFTIKTMLSQLRCFS